MGEFAGLLSLFERLVPERFLNSIEEQGKRRGIFSTALVAWLLIYRRLEAGSSMSRAMLGVACGQWQELTCRSKRVRKGRISERTGGYRKLR